MEGVFIRGRNSIHSKNRASKYPGFDGIRKDYKMSLEEIEDLLPDFIIGLLWYHGLYSLKYKMGKCPFDNHKKGGKYSFDNHKKGGKYCRIMFPGKVHLLSDNKFGECYNVCPCDVYSPGYVAQKCKAIVKMREKKAVL